MSLEATVKLRRDEFVMDARLSAEENETVALLGPNGSGKSTLVGMLAGIVRPDAGTVTLDGVVLDDRRTHVQPEHRPIGLALQDLALFPHLPAIENAAFPLRAGGAGRADATERAGRLLERLGLPVARHGARPRDLSGGEAQRVALARALIREPRLLLLDEPTSALDVRARAELRPLLKGILAGFHGIRILVTHDPVEAMTLGDRLVVLENGRVSQSGRPAELREAPRTPYVAELVGVNLYAGRIEPLEPGAARLRTPDGDLVVAWPQTDGPSEDVVGLLRPADVALHTTRPEGGSARNLLHGRITGLSLEGERARVRIGSAPPVVAEVTLGSVDRLGLIEGAEVWASCKAVEIRLLRSGGAAFPEAGTLGE